MDLSDELLLSESLSLLSEILSSESTPHHNIIIQKLLQHHIQHQVFRILVRTGWSLTDNSNNSTPSQPAQDQCNHSSTNQAQINYNQCPQHNHNSQVFAAQVPDTPAPAAQESCPCQACAKQ